MNEPPSLFDWKEGPAAEPAVPTQASLFNQGVEDAISRSRACIREEMQTVASAWEALPDGWGKKAISQKIVTDKFLRQADAAMTREFRKLKFQALDAPAREEAEKRVKEAMEFYRKRALEIIGEKPSLRKFSI